jgi:DNA-3-methyladenine glycosylase
VKLPAEWYQRDVLEVAPDLIGTTIVHGDRRGMITEVEAYLGPEDLASHTRFGITKRNAVMFGPGGISYVYLCYGVHEMFNIVTGVDGQGQAVLVRAVHVDDDDPSIGRGPGKVTTALGLNRTHGGKDLTLAPLHLLARTIEPPIATGPRIGVDFAGEWAARPYRFWWRDHRSVSKPSKAKPRRARR